MDFKKLLTTVAFSTLCLTVVPTYAEAVKPMELSPREAHIVPIAAYTANGDLAKLETALHDGLDHGLTVNEIKEILIQMYAYTGFPRSLNGINTFIKVSHDRQAKGIHDPVGTEPQVLPKDTDKDAYGEKVRMSLFGLDKPIPLGEWQTFTPGIDTYLKEHLFADIFARGVLSHKDREIATVAALGAMKGVEPQLKAHMVAAMTTGVADSQVQQIVSLLGQQVGAEEGQTAQKVYDGIMASRIKR